MVDSGGGIRSPDIMVSMQSNYAAWPNGKKIAQWALDNETDEMTYAQRFFQM